MNKKDLNFAKRNCYEAGGKVTNFFREEQRYDTDINGAIISNRKVHDEVVKIIKPIE